MLDGFLEGIGDEFAKRWIGLVFTPAALFWLAGLGAWAIGHDDGPKRIRHYIMQLGSSERVELAALILLLVAGSALAMTRVQLVILRFLQGYGWRRLPGGKARTERWVTRRNAARDIMVRYQHLPAQTVDEMDQWVKAQDKVHRIPPRAEFAMPTRFGNILRASELRPLDHYGLDAAVCLPRLWLLLPDTAREEVSAASGHLRASVMAWAWALLLATWTLWTPYALVAAAAGTVATYASVLTSASEFGDLLESCFDVHRWELYKALRWPAPSDADAERKAGEQLSQFLWAGLTSTNTKWTT